MKAIINVSRKSSFADLIGYTFQVKEITASFVALDINGKTTDFGFKELLIVDFHNELMGAYMDYISNRPSCYSQLKLYALANKIDYISPRVTN